MIYWKENDTTEPPLCKKFTDTELESNIRNKIPICFPVERTVKLVTDASQEARSDREGKQRRSW